MQEIMKKTEIPLNKTKIKNESWKTIILLQQRRQFNITRVPLT
jgi:hypothetical protein